MGNPSTSTKKALSIITRYALLLLVTFPNFYIFYFIFTPLTIFPVYFLLNLLFDVSLINNILIVNHFSIELIDACIAGAAYYLLFALNLSIPNINLKKRVLMVFSSFVALLILNVLRIVFLSMLFLSGSDFFDITHKISWYALSTIFVVGIWLMEIKTFKLKEIPFYSDARYLFKKSSLNKRIKSKI